MLSFSTCWNGHRHTDGEALVNEVLLLGFDTVELSHGMRMTLFPGFRKAFEQGRIRVSGVHNFCPSPVEIMIDAPDAYEFTSRQPDERERAIRLTLKSIDTAVEFDAGYLVIHLGSIPMKHYSRRLTRMVEEGKIHSREYVKLKLKLVETRERMAPLYLERAREALDILVPYAEEKNVVLGIESRSQFEDVPSERELETLLAEYPSRHVGYWHDFGHVQLKANLALLDHEQWLNRMAPRLAGCHLHDVVWPGSDHQVPFQGSLPYDRLMPLVPRDRPLVWELNPRRKTNDIKSALAEWKALYGN